MSDLLNDTETYKVFKVDSTRQYKKELEILVKKGKEKGFIIEKEEKYLIPETCSIPSYTQSPKSTKIAQTHQGTQS